VSVRERTAERVDTAGYNHKRCAAPEGLIEVDFSVRDSLAPCSVNG